jgi:hypothetical protein
LTNQKGSVQTAGVQLQSLTAQSVAGSMSVRVVPRGEGNSNRSGHIRAEMFGSAESASTGRGFDLLHTAKAVGFPAGDIQVARLLGSQVRFRVERQRSPSGFHPGRAF